MIKETVSYSLTCDMCDRRISMEEKVYAATSVGGKAIHLCWDCGIHFKLVAQFMVKFALPYDAPIQEKNYREVVRP